MPRLIGVDIPNNKRVIIALTYIYGIGPTAAAAGRDVLVELLERSEGNLASRAYWTLKYMGFQEAAEAANARRK